MTALARPEPAPLDASAFGRVHDDRLPIMLAGGAAVLLHFFAAFIPLPDKPQPEVREPVFRERPIGTVIPAPPDAPEPPPDMPPSQDLPLIPVPLPDIPDHLMIVEHDVTAPETVEIVSDYDVPTLLGPVEPPAPPPEFYDVGQEGLILPVPIDQPDPDFPEMARKIRQSGRVILRAVVDPSGRVSEIEVVFAPDPDWGFSEAAIRAVETWRYQPGRLRGGAVPVRLTVVVEFSLY